MQTKITLIGAGSVVFAKNLISDLLQFKEFSEIHICLMDIDADRLKVAEVMTRKIVAKLGVPATVSATLDRTEAVRGAKYVICTIQVGGYKPGTVIDFEIPKKYGLRQTIADTLGIGGIFRALRTIPKLVDIARDIETVGAPGCLFLNYTNPMAMNCMAVDRAVGIPMVGLCHSVQGTSKQLSNYLGLDYGDVTYKVAGINHMAFFLEFKNRGQDAYPLLFKKLEDPNFAEDKVRFEMMRRLGYFVTESSEHQAEYTPHFIHHGQDKIDQFDIPIDEYIRRCESIISSWKQTEADLLGADGEIQVKPQTHEYGSYIIHSMETGTPRVIYGNVPNTGLITNLPQRCCVELPVLVDNSGLQPTFIGDLPPQLAAICRTNINPQDLAVEAALTGKREHVYHAAMADPHTAATLPLDKIWALCDELIDAHAKEGYLPELSDTIRNTGRGFKGTADKVFAKIKQQSDSGDSQAASFELHLDNRTGSPYQGNIQIRLSSEERHNQLVQELEVTLAPGDSKAFPFSLEADKLPAAYSLFPDADDQSLSSMAFQLSQHEEIQVPTLEAPPSVEPSGLYREGADVELEFMSVPLLSGKAALHDDKLYLSFRVLDTKVELNEHRPESKSCIALQFSPETGSNKVEKVHLLPKEGKSYLRGHVGIELPSHAFTTRIDKAGYTTCGSIDLKKLGIASKSEFLFNFIVSAGALGDAHGACRAAWKGDVNSEQGNQGFARFVPAEAKA